MRGVGVLLIGIIAVTGAIAAPADEAAFHPPPNGVTVEAVVVAAPITVDVIASDVAVGRQARIRAVVANHSTVPVSDLVVTLLLGEPFVILGSGDVSVADLRPRARRQVGWSVCAAYAGNAIAVVQARGRGPGDRLFEITSAGVVLESQTALGRSGC